MGHPVRCGELAKNGRKQVLRVAQDDNSKGVSRMLFSLPADAVFGVFEEDAFLEEFVADGVGAGEVALLFG